MGQEATIEMTPAAACLVHKGFSSGYSLGKKQYPAKWGNFRQRGIAEGIPIRVRYGYCASLNLNNAKSRSPWLYNSPKSNLVAAINISMKLSHVLLAIFIRAQRAACSKQLS